MVREARRRGGQDGPTTPAERGPPAGWTGWPQAVRRAAARRLPPLRRLIEDRERLAGEVHALRGELEARDRELAELRGDVDALRGELEARDRALAGLGEELAGLQRSEGRPAPLRRVLTGLRGPRGPVEEGFQARRVRHQYGPVRLSLHIGDPMAAEWYDVEWPEPDIGELRFLPRYQTRPGATVFDLGAHQGVYALMLAHAVGGRGRVIAVEANRFNVDVMGVNCRLNRVRNVEAVQAAVAGQPGWLSFGRGNNGQVDTAGTFPDSQRVRAVTIDGLTERYGRPALIFLDVEGYECQALQGASATLATRPDVFIEVHVGCGLEDFGGSVEELVGFFPERDYELYGSNDLDRYPKPFVGERRQLAGDRFYLIAIARDPPA
jgi:FkbM family methyltransferase